MFLLGAPIGALLTRDAFQLDEEPESRFHRLSRLRKSITSVVTMDPPKDSCRAGFTLSVVVSVGINELPLLPGVAPGGNGAFPIEPRLSLLFEEPRLLFRAFGRMCR